MGVPSRRVHAIAAAAIALNILAGPAQAGTCGPYELHAHRGASSQPENSVEAVTQALSMDFRAVEIDLQRLADGAWVLHHDPVLGRVVVPGSRSGLGAAPRAEAVTTRQWKASTVMGRDGQPADVAPPMLSDLLKQARGIVSRERALHLEVKSRMVCEQAATLHRQIGKSLPTGSWMYSAFDLDALECLRAEDPSVYLGVVIGPEQGSISPHLQKAKAFASRFSPKAAEAAEQASAAYEGSFNRTQLEPTKLRALVARIGAPIGVHVDAATLAARPAISKAASDAGAKVLSYSTQGDAQHLEQLSRLRASGGRMPGGMIIDGDPGSFCLTLMRLGE